MKSYNAQLNLVNLHDLKVSTTQNAGSVQLSLRVQNFFCKYHMSNTKFHMAFHRDESERGP